MPAAPDNRRANARRREGCRPAQSIPIRVLSGRYPRQFRLGKDLPVLGSRHGEVAQRPPVLFARSPVCVMTSHPFRGCAPSTRERNAGPTAASFRAEPAMPPPDCGYRPSATACSLGRTTQDAPGSPESRDRPLAVEPEIVLRRQRLGAVQQRQQFPLLADGHRVSSVAASICRHVRPIMPAPGQRAAPSPDSRIFARISAARQFLEVAGRPSLDTLHKREFDLEFSFKQPRMSSATHPASPSRSSQGDAR